MTDIKKHLLTPNLIFGSSNPPKFYSWKDGPLQTCKTPYWRNQNVTSSDWITFTQVQYWKNGLDEVRPWLIMTFHSMLIPSHFFFFSFLTDFYELMPLLIITFISMLFPSIFFFFQIRTDLWELIKITWIFFSFTWDFKSFLVNCTMLLISDI